MVLPLDKIEISAKELKYFSAFFVLISLLQSCPYTGRLVYPALIVALAYGMVLLIKFFLQGKCLLKRPLFLPLFLFCAIYCVNMLLHFQDGLSTFFKNGGQLTLAGLYFFIFFFHFSTLNSREKGDVLRFSFNIYIAGALFISIVSLIMLLFQYQGSYFTDGVTYTIGMKARFASNGMISYQLLGIGTSSSILGGLCATASFASIISLSLNGDQHRRFYIVSIIIFMLTLCAANAFTSAAIIMVFTASYVGCHYLTAASALHGGRLARRICKLIALMFCTLFFVYVLYYAVQGAEASVVNLFERMRVTLFSTISRIITSITSSITSSPAVPGTTPGTTPEAPLPLPPMLIERTLETSVRSGRLEIWAAGFEKFLEHPIFGVTNENAAVYVHDTLFVNLHNAYLTLLVGTGIIGFGLILCFGLPLLCKALHYIFTQSEDKAKPLSLMLSICLAILAGNFVNGNFVFAPSASYLLLWILLGEIYNLTFAQMEPMEFVEKEIRS